MTFVVPANVHVKHHRQQITLLGNYQSFLPADYPSADYPLAALGGQILLPDEKKLKYFVVFAKGTAFSSTLGSRLTLLITWRL